MDGFLVSRSIARKLAEALANLAASRHLAA